MMNNLIIVACDVVACDVLSSDHIFGIRVPVIGIHSVQVTSCLLLIGEHPWHSCAPVAGQALSLNPTLP